MGMCILAATGKIIMNLEPREALDTNTITNINQEQMQRLRLYVWISAVEK